jgi:hypothetical protein
MLLTGVSNKSRKHDVAVIWIFGHSKKPAFAMRRPVRSP